MSHITNESLILSSQVNCVEAGQSLYFLDGLRGLVALYVAIFHAYGLLWEGFSSGYLLHWQQYPLVARLIAYSSFIFAYGHQAVVLFFIMSGFVIHLRYAKQRALPTDRFDLLPFYGRRARRIYPPLLLIMVLTFVLDTHRVTVSNPSANITFPLVIQYDALPLRLFSTLTLFPFVNAPEWGSDIVLWSLRFEWWFYLAYPLLWWVSHRNFRVGTALVMALCIVFYIVPGNDIFLAQQFFSLLLVWWIGALLAEIYAGKIAIPFGSISRLTWLLIPLLFSVAPFMTINENFRDILWGFGFAGLFAWLFTTQQHGGSLHWLERLKPIGDMSYTLYISHMPIMAFIGTWLIAQSATHSPPMTFEWIILGTLIAVIAAWLLHFVVEKPFQRRQMVRSATSHG